MKEPTILVAAADGKRRPVGEIWRITAKGSDFYFDAADEREAFHLSIHGPKGERFAQHGFFLRVDNKYARIAHLENQFMTSGIGRKGHVFNGLEVDVGSYHVIRVRWLWDLFRERYFPAAYAGEVPELTGGSRGVAMMEAVDIGHVIDLDVYLSYKKPYWPNVGAAFRQQAAKMGGGHGDGRLGPMRAEGDMLLTAVFVQRWAASNPTPQAMIPPRPLVKDVPNRLTCFGIGPSKPNDISWVVQSITSMIVVKESQRAWLDQLAARGVAT